MSDHEFPFLGPLHLPADQADLLEELEPVLDDKGRVCRRVRHPILGIGTQQHVDLIDIGEVKVMPLKAPSGLIFYEDYQYKGMKEDGE